MTRPSLRPPHPRYYSQHGEDAVLHQAFVGTEGPRFFVEVGMIDGLRFSNSYFFEQLGWSGLCVEPQPEYFEMATESRSVPVVQAAAGPIDGVPVRFYATERGALSTLKPRDEEDMSRAYGDNFDGYTEIAVMQRTLDSILAEHGAPTRMEFISIDVEGAEAEVLAGLDLARWNPRVLVLEVNSADAGYTLSDTLAEQGYLYTRHTGCNWFFTNNVDDFRRVAQAEVRRTRPTKHPLAAPRFTLAEMLNRFSSALLGGTSNRDRRSGG